MKILSEYQLKQAEKAGMIFILNKDGTLTADAPENHFPTNKGSV